MTGTLPESIPASLPFWRALHAAVAAFYRARKESGQKPPLEFIQREFAIVWETEVGGQRLSFKGKTSAESHMGLGKALLQKFYDEIQPRKVEAIEYPFAVPLADLNTGETLDRNPSVTSHRMNFNHSFLEREREHV